MSHDLMLNALRLTSGSNNCGGTSTSGIPASATQRSSTEASTSTSGTLARGPILEEEIGSILLRYGPVTTKDLVDAFKERLKTEQDRKAFAVNLKRIAKLLRIENKAYVVLKKWGYYLT